MIGGESQANGVERVTPSSQSAEVPTILKLHSNQMLLNLVMIQNNLVITSHNSSVYMG